MDIAIGRRMRELRASKKNTQEQLAAHLGITVQAVSKWEREEGYPDISLLPAIASFYGVSVDSLLGVDEIERQRKLQEYTERSKQQRSASDRIAVWREAYREFPNEPTVLHNRAFALRSEGIEQHSDELIYLGKRLLKDATQSGEYFGAISHLSRAYMSQGNKEEARRYAAMAGRYIGTENQLLIRILEGEEAASICRWNIETLVDLIATNAKVMLQKGTFANEEHIHIAERVVRLYELIYEEDNFGTCHRHLSNWYMRAARGYAESENAEETLRCLEKAFHHAKQYDALEEGTYTAMLVRGQKFARSQNAPGVEEKRCRDVEDCCFAFVRDDYRFQLLHKN